MGGGIGMERGRGGHRERIRPRAGECQPAPVHTAAVLRLGCVYLEITAKSKLKS